MSNPHEYISVTCLIHLSEHLDLVRKVVSKDPSALSFSSILYSVPLLSYAHRYWGEHARVSTLRGPLHPYTMSFLAQVKDTRYPGRLRGGVSAGLSGVVPETCPLSGLHLAAMYGLVDAIQAEGDSLYLHLPDPIYGFTPLHIAVMFNHLEAFRALLALGANVNARTNHKEATILHLAIGEHRRFGQLDIVRELLSPSSPSAEAIRRQGGLHVNAQDHEGITPLMSACSFPSRTSTEDEESPEEEIVRLLLARPDIKVNIQDTASCCESSGGRTALMHAAPWASSKTIGNLLAHPETDGNNQTVDGVTALMLACEYLALDNINALLSSRRVDPHLRANNGYSALEVACYPGEVMHIFREFDKQDVDWTMRVVAAILAAGDWSVSDICKATIMAMDVGAKQSEDKTWIFSRRIVQRLLLALRELEGGVSKDVSWLDSSRVIVVIAHAARMACPAWIRPVMEGLEIVSGGDDTCPCLCTHCNSRRSDSEYWNQ